MDNFPMSIPYMRANDDTLNRWTDEFDITFIKGDSSVERLVEFAEVYSDKRINIKFPAGIDFSALKLAYKISGNVRARLETSQMNHIDKLKEEGLPFFIDYFCDNWTIVDSMLELGVTDILVAGDLVHDLANIKRLSEHRGVRTRLVLNKVMNGGPVVNEKACVFIPQLMETFERYIDVFEFNVNSPETGKPHNGLLNVLVKAFFLRRQWVGSMDEIISGTPFPFFNDHLLDNIYVDRFFCGFRCMSHCTAPKGCHKCKDVFELYNLLEEKKAAIAQ